MDAAASGMQHSCDSGPRGPNPARGGQRAHSTLPPGAPWPEDQHHHHHKPFFYVQPSQPYLPMQGVQWPVPLPMPLSYSPYYGYTGIGYGMPMLPNCHSNPYVEPPSFILPHSHLHLMDYRRVLNPQYYQTMAYHSRRFRYQQSRETTSSEVQTEPLRTSTPTSGNVEVIASATPLLAPVSTLAQQGDRPSDSTSNGGFVIQTEEVRIECCATPVGLQVLHSREAAEVSHSFSQEAERGANVLHGKPLSLPSTDGSDQHALQVCPDILLMGSPASGEATVMAPEEGLPATDSNGGPLVAVQGNATGPQSTFINLPFDANYLDELRRMESTVWSAEETLVASPEQDKVSQSCVEQLERLAADETPVGEEMNVPAPELEVGSRAADEVVSEADAEQDVPAATEMQSADVGEAPYLLLLDKSPSKQHDQEQPRRETTVQDQQDTSFESLPAYLPSTSWLADFDHGQYTAKLPPTSLKRRMPSLLEPASRQDKLDLDYWEQSVTGRKSKIQRYKPRGKAERRSLSDHECCLGRSYENVLTSCGTSRKERLCTRCLAKRRLYLAISPGGATTTARKSLPFQPLQGCSSCKCHPDTAKTRTSPGGGTCQQHGRCGHDTEGESSENGGSSCCQRSAKWRRADDPRQLGDLNRPLASKQNLAALPPPPPAAAYLKMREKSCVCGERQLQRQQVAAWQRRRHCHHGNGIQELDENSGVPASFPEKWRSREQIYLTHRCHTEKSWKAAMPKPNAEVSKIDMGSQHITKHRKSQAQSQGTRRKDTRC